MFRSQPELALPRHSLPEKRRLDQRVTSLVHLVAYRRVAVDRVPPALVRLVALARRAAVVQGRPAVVAMERLAELVPLQPAVAAAVVQAVAAAEQTRSMR